MSSFAMLVLVLVVQVIATAVGSISSSLNFDDDSNPEDAVIIEGINPQSISRVLLVQILLINKLR